MNNLMELAFKLVAAAHIIFRPALIIKAATGGQKQALKLTHT